MLPYLLAALAAVALFAGLFTLWLSLRTAFGVVTASGWVDDEAADRASLLLEKEALLRSLRDLRDEHDAGKVSAEDFDQQNDVLREQTAAVLKELDDELEPYREKAEQLLHDALREAGLDPRSTGAKEGDAKAERSPAGAAASGAGEGASGESTPRRTCGGCNTVNDADARFCKHCAKPLDAEASQTTSPQTTSPQTTSPQTTSTTEDAKADAGTGETTKGDASAEGVSVEAAATTSSTAASPAGEPS